MLEGRRREAGRRAGLTSSPDFFRTMGGRLVGPSLSSSSSESCLEDAGEVIRICVGDSNMMLESVLDRECEILRASLDNGGRVSTVRVLL